VGKKNKRINRDTDVHDEETIRQRREGKLLLLTRKQIVTRILDTAAMLWLGDADPISIHILACVAHQNLHKIATKQGADRLNLKVATGWEDIYSAYNDLKHSTGDPNHRDQFVVENNEIMLFDCIRCFGNIFAWRSPWMNTFAGYIMIHCDFVKANDPPDEVLPGVRISEVINLSRKAFVEKMYPIFVDAHKRGFH
jgi:hypothetical protein